MLVIPELQVAALLAFLLGIFLNSLIQCRLASWLMYCALSGAVLLLNYFSLMLYFLYITPVLVPLGLLVFFGRTLLPGREPLITAIGEAARGPLTLPMRKYTRRLTQVWCCVFLVMALWSGTLPWLKSPELWSWFTNIINYGVVSILFVGEFILRKKLFPEHDHPSFIEYLRIIFRSSIRH